jgi:hypothetical protein
VLTLLGVRAQPHFSTAVVSKALARAVDIKDALDPHYAVKKTRIEHLYAIADREMLARARATLKAGSPSHGVVGGRSRSRRP